MTFDDPFWHQQQAKGGVRIVVLPAPVPATLSGPNSNPYPNPNPDWMVPSPLSGPEPLPPAQATFSRCISRCESCRRSRCTATCRSGLSF